MEKKKVDVLVVGSGIAGLQASLDLADQGKKVFLLEKNPSIGGTMINLSKVFPTLDCASCITTPRMASSIHHPNIETWTYSELKDLKKENNIFRVTVRKKPRYVKEDACIGCKRCEEVCPIYMPDDFEHNLGAKKAISIPFTNAIPQYPVLDMNYCMLCGACAKACPTSCIDYAQEAFDFEVEADSVIISTGLKVAPLELKRQYGGGEFPNVLSPLQAERLLAPHGPFGRVIRPSDGKVPDSIAFVQCAASRDQSINIPYCSRVCCMFSIKQAMLLSGSLPVADITIYYMDIRAFGKGYEQFYQNAKAMGIQFVKAKVGRITEDDHHNLSLRIERQESDGSYPEEVSHDLVILSQGILPGWDGKGVLKECCGDISKDGFLRDDEGKTSIEGLFAAGVALGPKDIVDTVAEASAAAVEASRYIKNLKSPLGGKHE